MSHFIVKNRDTWEEKLLTVKQLEPFLKSNISKKDLKEKFSYNYKPWIKEVNFNSSVNATKEIISHLNENPFSEATVGKYEIKHLILQPKATTKYIEFFNKEYHCRQIELDSIKTKKGYYYSITLNPEYIQIYFSDQDTSCFFYVYHNGNANVVEFLAKEITNLCKKDLISPSFLKDNLGTLMSSNESHYFPQRVNKTNFNKFKKWLTK